MTNVKPNYKSPITIAINEILSLANDATNLLAGAQSDEIINSTNLDIDGLISGVIKTGATSTSGNKIEVWVFPSLDGANKYADTITNAGHAAKTLTSANMKNAGGRLGQIITVDGTGNREYGVNFLLSEIFSQVPKKFVVFVINGSGGLLNAATSALYYQGEDFSIN